MAAVAYPIPHDRRHLGRLASRPELRFVAGDRRPPCPVVGAHPSVYARRRAVAALLFGFLVGLAVLGVSSVAIGPASSPARAVVPDPVRVAAVRTHVVQPGESLWAVARGMRAGGDIRTTVARLAALNGGSTVRAGQVLVLP